MIFTWEDFKALQPVKAIQLERDYRGLDAYVGHLHFYILDDAEFMWMAEDSTGELGSQSWRYSMKLHQWVF